MSKMSEDLFATMKYRDDNGAAQEMYQMAKNGTAADNYPGFDMFSRWARWKINGIMRKGKALYGGADPWPNGAEAFLQTAEKLQVPVYLMLVEATSAGITIGMEKMNHPGSNFAGLFKNNQEDSLNWALKVKPLTVEISEDWDAMSIISKELADCLGAFGSRAGMANWVGKETQKVWDCWDRALSAISAKFFLTGMDMGAKWHDEEVLAGILKVTEGFHE